MDCSSYRSREEDLLHEVLSIGVVCVTRKNPSLFFRLFFTHTATRYFYKYLSSSIILGVGDEIYAYKIVPEHID